ncbi:SAF domain-containing protein [Rhodococcus spongiicola]|uniref:Flagellar biosynthesis protein FlgA n=1 Tax=Rhodococcus spongiicola TaxID=2487352 RepID=A0A3S3BAA3_9NOCA|nr:SAF domain-containing protein [Rhodococcus spongiicola]RVW06758.1 flagellar biosynthesis protein FlgA [Rhodococcus spongiicola]
MPRDVFRRRDTGSLAPTLSGRIGRFLRPDWARADTARRVTAGLLALLALVMLIRDGRGETGEPVVVAARDLTPGHVLAAEDVRTVDRARTEVPGAAVQDQEAAVGRTVSSPVRSGEILTDVRLLGPRLAEAAVGSSDARVVPVRLSDSGLAELIREGDRVDVLTVGRARDVDASQPTVATVLASGATVVLVASEHPSAGRRDPVVMLALPAPAASAVAAASLTDAITVTLH